MSVFFTRPDAHVSLFYRGRVRQSVLRVSAPAALAGARAVYLADVHLRARTPDAWLDGLLAEIGKLRPDLLLLGGDYAETPAQERRFFTALGACCRPPCGAYGVVGNNDREGFPEIADLRACMAAGGVRLLLNERLTVPVRGGRLAICGIDEEKHGEPQRENLFAGCEGADLRLLLEHMPRWPEESADLVLAGHTHGGQLNFLGLTPFSVGFEGTYPVVRGAARQGGTTLLVTRGLGYSRLPLRVGVYPEYHVIEFVGGAGF